MLCGGVHKFATTSWNTIRSIVSSLKFIQTCTGGKLAGLPLTLKYFKKATQTKTGKATTIPVVTIVYEGNPVQMLESAINTERKRIEAGIQLETLEAQVRREMKQLQIVGPLEEDEIPEFHPEEEVDQQPQKDISQALQEETAKPVTGEPLTVEPEKPTKPEPKTDEIIMTKAEYKCSACGRTSDNPGACKCAEGKVEVTGKSEPTTTVPATEPPKTKAPAQEAKPSQTPPRGEMQKEITKLRAVNRIQTADWQELVKSAGIKDLNAASWSDAEMYKVLEALKAKGA
jgi:hypothetical protein